MSGHSVPVNFRIRSPRFELIEAESGREMQVKVNDALERGFEPWGALVVSATDEDARRFYQWVMGYEDMPELKSEGFVQVVSDVAPEVAAQVNKLMDPALAEGRNLTGAEIDQVQGLLADLCQPAAGPSELDLTRAGHEPCTCLEHAGDEPACVVHGRGTP